MKKAFYVLVFLIICIISFCQSCASADKNITSNDYGCSKVTIDNAMSCCLKDMSSNTGNDSKDIVCIDIVRELAYKFKEERKQSRFEFCEKRSNFQSCWDKLNSN